MFGLSLINGWAVFAGGSALIAAPILIHLLSKRKFRVLDWAAMDFLIEADKRNRRRIRLEQLLLLLLRCLAIVLIALLVARPRIHAAGFAASALAPVGVDRIVVLDDSLSMSATESNRVPFTTAIESLKDLADALTAGHARDTLTLILASNPRGPYPLDRKALSDPGAGRQVHDLLDTLRPTDLTARFDVALTQVRTRLTARDAGRRKVLYIVSDLRDRDWHAPADLPEDQTLPGKVRLLSGQADGCYLIDAGPDHAGSNLLVTDIRAEDNTLVAGAPGQFDLTVTNYGPTAETEVPVLFYADKSVPLRQTIAKIEPDQSATVRFAYTFRQPGQVKLHARVDRPGALPADKTIRLYPANVTPGVAVLLVEGNAAPGQGYSDGLFVRIALTATGERSGNRLTTVGQDEFERVALDPFQSVFLCNCDLRNLSSDRLRTLTDWTRRGGGLVIFLGNDADETAYNAKLFDPRAAGSFATTEPASTDPDLAPADRYAPGLLPAKLLVRRGDSDFKQYVGLTVDQTSHPVFDWLAGGHNPLLSGVKFYRWWGVEVAPRPDRKLERPPRPVLEKARKLSVTGGDYQAASPYIPRLVPLHDETELAYVLGAKQARTLAQPVDPGQGKLFLENLQAGFEFARLGRRDSVRILARFTDEEHSPAIVEHACGQGRVVLFTTSPNTAWHNWPSDQTGSFPGTVYRLGRYVARPTAGAGLLTVGDPLTYQLDSARYRPQAQLFPGGLAVENAVSDVPAHPLDPRNPRFLTVRFDGVTTADFYLLRLLPHRVADAAEFLFAANIDPTEADLKRTDLAALEQKLGAQVTLLRGRAALTRDAVGSGTELWRPVLLMLVLVLGVEQTLAWAFGRRR